MKRFFIQLVIFLLPIIIILLILDYAVTMGLQKSGYGEINEWNDIYHSRINSEVIINGSSRGWIHVSPKIVDSILSTDSYNLGINGHFFHMQYTKYNEFERYNQVPKIVVQTLDVFTLQKRDDLYDFEQFLPYIYKSNIRCSTKQYKGFSRLDYFLPFYRYLNNLEIAKIGFDEFFEIKHYKNDKYKGYKGMNSKWDGKFEVFKKQYPKGLERTLDDQTIVLFDQYLKECKQKKIMVFLVYTPELNIGQKLTTNRDEIINLYNDFSAKYGYPFFDYSNDSISNQKNLFYNTQHLNKKGAEFFTIKLANDIKKWQNNNN